MLRSGEKYLVIQTGLYKLSDKVFMKKFFCFVLSSLMLSVVFANTTSSSAANRKTALRYLQLAKNYLVKNDWEAVKKTCDNGIQYDDNVADLYYLKALSLFNLSCPRYEIIPVIEKSLSTTEWVDYNMSNARVFYADLLCSTGKPFDAISVLDKAPLIYSSDAEYVRIKSLYEINSADSIAKAEEKIESARRVYPNDVRFFYLFFNYEYNLCYKVNADRTGFDKKELSPVARKIADSFIAHVPNYDKSYTDLEILASVFAEGENQRRLLKAFNARGFNHILYPIAALEAEIISEEEALEYFLTFIDGTIEAKLLMQFYSMITDESLKKYFDEHLNAFKGTLIYDTNNNLEENLTVVYERGRASKVIFDFDNDQFVEWEVECDFGVPVKIKVFDQLAQIIYGTYPDVKSILFEDEEPGVKGFTAYNIIDETFSSKPFDIIKAPEVLTTDFYVIDESTLIFGKALFDSDRIIASANEMDKPSLERKNARIKFSILNGTPYEASYYIGNKEYAHGYFGNGNEDVSIVRAVDKDDDGIFETTEFYAINSKLKLSEEERDAITTNIWGSPVKDASLYLAGIAIDRNLDTAIDFKETYFENGDVLTEWSSNYDSTFDVSYRKYKIQEGKPLTEEYSYFVKDIADNSSYKLTVLLQNSKPVSISIPSKSEMYSVIPGKYENLFWIGVSGNEEYELNIIGIINSYDQGQMFQMDEKNCYIRVVRVGENIFARILDKEIFSDASSSGTDENE